MDWFLCNKDLRYERAKGSLKNFQLKLKLPIELVIHVETLNAKCLLSQTRPLP